MTAADKRNPIFSSIRRALKKTASQQDLKAETLVETFNTLTTTSNQKPSCESKPELIRRFIDRAHDSAAGVSQFANQETALDDLFAQAKKASQPPAFRFDTYFENYFINHADNTTDRDTKLFSQFSSNSDTPLKGSWGLTKAWAAVAETGSVVSTSQHCAGNLLFLVEHLFVLVDEQDILPNQQDLWVRKKRDFPQQLPRSFQIISGPSRTGDVEQTIQLGAHGPRRVDYLLVV